MLTECEKEIMLNPMVKKLLEWFEMGGKSYPFRDTTDPYRILVSEMLLRQTTARQVATIYPIFFEKFPTVKHLSKAPIDEIKKTIKPLGIASRAHDLKQVSQEIVSKYGGKIPENIQDLIKLKGVGKYIANCVMAFGFEFQIAAVDSNINRVLSRIMGLRVDFKKQPDYRIWKFYYGLMPRKKRREFHHAIIDLAHLFCRPSNPKCGICPLKEYCNYQE